LVRGNPKAQTPATEARGLRRSPGAPKRPHSGQEPSPFPFRRYGGRSRSTRETGAWLTDKFAPCPASRPSHGAPGAGGPGPSTPAVPPPIVRRGGSRRPGVARRACRAGSGWLNGAYFPHGATPSNLRKLLVAAGPSPLAGAARAAKEMKPAAFHRSVFGNALSFHEHQHVNRHSFRCFGAGGGGAVGRTPRGFRGRERGPHPRALPATGCAVCAPTTVAFSGRNELRGAWGVKETGAVKPLRGEETSLGDVSPGAALNGRFVPKDGALFLERPGPPAAAPGTAVAGAPRRKGPSKGSAVHSPDAVFLPTRLRKRGHRRAPPGAGLPPPSTLDAKPKKGRCGRCRGLLQPWRPHSATGWGRKIRSSLGQSRAGPGPLPRLSGIGGPPTTRLEVR